MFAGLLLAVHSGIAQVAHAPEFQIDEVSAKELAKSSAQLADMYGSTIDPRAVVWMQFAGVAASVYVPRFMAYAARKAEERKKRDASGPQTARG